MSLARVLVVIFISAACVRPGGAPRETPGSSLPARDSIEGSFHIVYGEAARYFVIDSASRSIEVLFADDSARTRFPLLSYDRRKVRVIGWFSRLSRSVFHITHIALANTK